MWKTEREFSNSLLSKLKLEGFDTMRIETASTVSGCPDLWVQGAGDDYFIELKNIHGEAINNKIKIPWRPGQQAWAARYFQNHISKPLSDKTATKVSWTFVGYSDKNLDTDYVICIRMNKPYIDNVVDITDDAVYIIPWRIFSAKDLLLNNTYGIS